MKKLKNIALFLFVMSFIITSCSESPLPEPENPAEIKTEASEITQKVNSFIEVVMNDIYLWYKDVPNLDIRYEFDSEDYFYKLLHKDDNWSFITDDVHSLENTFEGVETSFGYSLVFGSFTNTGNKFAIVEFVYPDTPASEAGIERGDIIVKMNGNDITEGNARNLFDADNLNLTFGTWDGGSISIDSETVNIEARELNLDPVVVSEVVEHDTKKIGYMFYAQYIGDYNSSLDNAFQYFLEEGITDLVVDLRYNPGGGIDAAQYFCSSIAPVSTVDNQETLVTFQWNDKYQKFMQDSNMVENLIVPFTNTTSVKLGLNKVYFLTGAGTASASELSITGLKPYMDVVMVGDTTFGKYTASQTFKAEQFFTNPKNYEDITNWGIQPIIARFANSMGVTDFKDGFIPDILVEENPFTMVPLGDKQDPLFKAAIEDITGTPVIAMKKARIPLPEFTIFDRGFSKYDSNKRELLIDGLIPDKMIK